MTTKLYTLLAATLMLLTSTSISAQTLSVAPVEAKAGEQATLTVNISEPSETTALQFNLQLPAGVTVNESGCTLGAAANNHVLSINRMESGDYLVVLYHMDLGQFTDGTLLTIPVTIAADAKTGSGKLYTVRSAKSDAVSLEREDTAFAITVTDEATGIKGVVEKDKDAQKICDISGRRVRQPSKGIYIVNGKKIAK